MSDKITCPQCEIEVDVTESHCPKCDAVLTTLESHDDLDQVDKTRVGSDQDVADGAQQAADIMQQQRVVVDIEDDVNHNAEDADDEEDLRTIQVEGFTGMDLASSGISFDSAPAPPPGGDAHLEDVEFHQFMVQEDRTVVGGSHDGHPQAWSGPVPSQPQAFGPASGAYPNAGGPFIGSGEYPTAGGAFMGSGEFPMAGSPYSGAPPQQPPGGFVYVEGFDSPSETVRQEGIVLGRQEELSTFSSPGDISRGSATTSPLRGVMWLGIGLIGLVIAAFLVKSYVPIGEQPIPAKIVQVMLEIKTTPSGADVWLNGKKVEQTTPAVVQARIDESTNLQIRKDKYKTVDFTWTPKGNDVRSFVLEPLEPVKPRVDPQLLALQAKAAATPAPAVRRKRVTRKAGTRSRRGSRVPPGHAALSLSTDPPGAKVRVQGRIQSGRTPLRVILQKGLEAKVTVQKYGHHDSYFIWKVDGNKSKLIRMYRHSWYNP